MTARIILHIGTHKTATTAIQNSLAANRGLLARHGVDYPALGRSPGHHGLAMKWVWLPEVYALPGGPAAGWEKIASMAREGRTVVLSSEEFSRGRPDPAVDFREIRKCLTAFDEVRVLCSVRDQLSYLQSIWLELGKKAAPPPWAQFLAQSLATGFAAGLYLDFNVLDDRLRQSFAREEIRYLDFATTRMAPGGMLGAILAEAASNLPPEALTTTNGGRANVSPDPLAAWAASQIAAPRVAPPQLVALAAAALRDEFPPGRRTTIYTRDETQRLLTRFATPNARFSERIAAHQPEFALTAPAPEPRFGRDELGPGFWLRIARQLHAPRQRTERTLARA